MADNKKEQERAALHATIWRIFEGLSNGIHGEADEEEALIKYRSFRRLVEGVIDNIKNKRELKDAALQLGFLSEGDAA